MWARWRIRVLPLLRQGRVVLCDRYMYDILTGYKNRPMDYQESLRERICSRYPKPDVGILLDAEPAVIFERKPQLSEEELIQARAAYATIAKDYHFLPLDTSIDVESTLAEFDERFVPEILKHLNRNRAQKTNPIATSPPTAQPEKEFENPVTADSA